jgi:hypothetical protein
MHRRPIRTSPTVNLGVTNHHRHPKHIKDQRLDQCDLVVPLSLTDSLWSPSAGTTVTRRGARPWLDLPADSGIPDPHQCSPEHVTQRHEMLG